MLSARPVQKNSAAVPSAAAIMPIRIQEIELGGPLPTLSAIDEKNGVRYLRVRCLVRLHDHPLGMIEFGFDSQELFPCDYVQAIWRSLRTEISEHLGQDGFAAISELTSAGLIPPAVPACIQEREAFYATAPFVSVIISTRDRAEQLAMSLPSLLSQHYPRYEVVIVDNAPSTQATAELIQQTYGEEARLRYVCEERPGLSRGMNRGIQEARGEILAFTDDDVVADSYWLLQLVKAFSSADDVICVTGLVLPFELETPAQILFEEFGGFSKGFCRRVYDLTEHRPREPLYPYTVGRFGTGANMAFRPDFLRRAGGFDLALQCGMDIAAFFQTIKQGHTLIYEPAALAYHTHRRSYAELQRQIHNYGVAITAFLTKSMIEQPRNIFELVTKIPYGLFFTFASRSPKNQKKAGHYPKDLTLLELKGMLSGPWFYLRRRRQYRHEKERTVCE
jgi:GT2 family glycosyltransferase